MKLPCELVQDLLPLYHDGVCSETSRNAVKAHLRECDRCRKLLNAMREDIEAEKEMAEAKPLASLSAVWKKNMKKALLKGVTVTALIFVLLLGCFLGLTQWQWLAIETVNMEVAEIYQLADGRILYRLEVPAGVWSRSFDFEHHEDGSSYLIPRRSIIELNEQQGWDSLLDNYLMIDAAEHNAWAENNGGVPMTKYYIGHPDASNPLLIWEEGMVLPEAPEHLEFIYG